MDAGGGAGAFTFVLHSHLPYCRRAGRWPHGEEWIHEAASETYLPLLLALDELVAEGVPIALTVGITPVLMEQLADPLIKQHLVEYLEDKLARAEADLARASASAGDAARRNAAAFYMDFYAGMLDAFEHRYRRDIVGAFRRLQDAGHLEIATSAATHGYLPLLARDSSITAQLATGIASYQRHMGRAPRAVWLPECAYRPATWSADGHRRPGIERFLAEQEITVFFSETHLVEGGRPVGKAGAESIGPYGEIRRRYVVPQAEEVPRRGTSFEAYWVAEPHVAVLARNNRTGMQVWSAEHGYPGDFLYREFHRKDGTSGLQYWSISGPGVDLGAKEWYDPTVAAERAREHAQHFASLVEGLLAEHRQKTGHYGVISAAYDTELFGHWWFEGVLWLKHVLRRLAASSVVDLTTASRYVKQHPPQTVLDLPEGSWGDAGSHFTWLNPDTEWMWPLIHEVEYRMERLVARHGGQRAERAVLQQAAREALLVQSSDWPFLVTTGQAREYAIQRFEDHLDRFGRLADVLERGDGGSAASVRMAEDLWELDRVFPDIDPAWFAAREPIAAIDLV